MMSIYLILGEFDVAVLVGLKDEMFGLSLAVVEVGRDDPVLDLEHNYLSLNLVNNEFHIYVILLFHLSQMKRKKYSSNYFNINSNITRCKLGTLFFFTH